MTFGMGQVERIVPPQLALDLPLKALDWQDDAGTVWVSYNSPVYLAARHSIPADLVKNLAWIEAMISAALLR